MPHHSRWLGALDRAATVLATAYAVDHAVKHIALAHFFHRPAPKLERAWPSVTMLHPITRGTHRLAATLQARAQLDYPAPVQHLFICDAADATAQRECRRVLVEHPYLLGKIITVAAPPDAPVAHKIQKLEAALPQAIGEVLCFIDDDVSPKPDALRRLIPYAMQPGIGAAFGMPAYTNWENVWSSLLSGYANATSLYEYAVQTYLIEPYRVLGQMVAYPRQAFAAAGGLNGMEGQIDDDYAIAQRLHAAGLHVVQTPVLFDVDNHMPTARRYYRQLKRWLVMPRQAMLKTITPRQSMATLCSSGFNFIMPGIVGALALVSWRPKIWRALLAMLGCFGLSYALNERLYLHAHTPPRRWPLLLAVAVLTPLQAIYMLTKKSDVMWRGQRLHVLHDGRAELVR